MKSVGSVGSGVGPCRRDKIMRVQGFQLARDVPELKPFLSDAVEEVYSTLEKKENILLEGDHGFKLSLIHGEYPKGPMIVPQTMISYQDKKLGKADRCAGMVRSHNRTFRHHLYLVQTAV